MFEMQLPGYVARVLERLKAGGAEGWLVGGCVRDALLGREPHDFDIAVSTPPEETARLFADGFRVIPTGLKHGTVTVNADGHDLELTTFRRDGRYADSRRPESVTFVSDIESDLSRRDFTVNAAAWSPDRGLCDPFGASEDVKNRIIRCVGSPEKRFGEDALRILRALRFASALDFAIEPETDLAIRAMYPSLADISRERVRAEFVKLVCGEGAVGILLGYKEVVGHIVPEFRPCMGYEPGNERHKYDVYEHCVRTSAEIKFPADGVDPEAEPELRLAALFHDIAKPECAVVCSDGKVRYPRHETAGARIAGDIMRRLRFDKATSARVCRIIARHDSYPKPNRNSVRRYIAESGERIWWMIEALRRADNSTKAEGAYSDVAGYFETVERLARGIIDAGECISPEMMKIKGEDLLGVGVSGVVLGDIKRRLYGEVIDGRLKNERDALIARAGELSEKYKKKAGNDSGREGAKDETV